MAMRAPVAARICGTTARRVLPAAIDPHRCHQRRNCRGGHHDRSNDGASVPAPEQLIEEGRGEDRKERRKRQHVARNIGIGLERREVMHGMPKERKPAISTSGMRRSGGARKRRGEAKQTKHQQGQPEARPQTLGKMKPAIGDRYRQRHVMAMRRVGVFGVDTAPELREIAERRKLDQHEDENGDAGNGKHAGEAPFAARARYEPDRGKRERQEQRADIFRSGGEAGIGTDERRACATASGLAGA